LECAYQFIKLASLRRSSRGESVTGRSSGCEVIQGNLPEEPFLLNCVETARTHRPIKNRSFLPEAGRPLGERKPPGPSTQRLGR